MLEIAEPDDAGFSMRRAAVVTGHETLDPEHAHATARQLIERRAAHCAEPADHDIELAMAGNPLGDPGYPVSDGRCAGPAIKPHSFGGSWCVVESAILQPICCSCRLTRDLCLRSEYLAAIQRAFAHDRCRGRLPPPAERTPSRSASTAGRASPPSACRLRLTADLASAPSLPAIEGPGECGADDVVRLEAVMLPDRRRIAVTPPAILRCNLAEAIVKWVREDVAPLTGLLDSALKSIDNYASYDCRGRNGIAGANLSEHGKANALDIRSLKLANGEVVGLTDPRVVQGLSRPACGRATARRFMTVLGPGSDGYHEDHVHVDLAERAAATAFASGTCASRSKEARSAMLPYRCRDRAPGTGRDNSRRVD